VFWGGGGKGNCNMIAQSKYRIPKSHLWAVLSNPLHYVVLRNVDFGSMLEKNVGFEAIKSHFPCDQGKLYFAKHKIQI
jgi:hypothetical protein